MRSRFLLVAVCAGLPSAAFAAAAADGDWAAPALEAAKAIAARPLPSASPAAVESEALRLAVLAEAQKNPVTARFAVPLLSKPGLITFVVASESEDASLKGVWALYRRDRHQMVLNRDGMGPAATDAQRAELARRYLPIFAHEIGGHARHYFELQALLGKPAPNVRETEIDAFWLEAMTIAARRKTEPGYLRDDGEYAKGESDLVDKYWEAKEHRDPGLFADYVTKPASYAKLPAATGAVAAYYQQDLQSIRAADKTIVGDDPPDDEAGVGRPDPFDRLRGR